MQRTATDSIDFLTDEVVPMLSSAADHAAEHLGDLPAAVGAIAGSSTARTWVVRGVTTVARRYPLVIGAAAIAGGAAHLLRKRKADAQARAS